MPVPKNLNYDMWLGSTPYVYYTEKRVHPQVGYDRPGWLRCEQFGAGMITGWGAHHVDSAHWGMDTEYTGPVEIWGSAAVPDQRPVGRPWRLQDVRPLRQRRHDGDQRRVSERDQVHRDQGWIFVSRGNETVTASDPVAKLQGQRRRSRRATRRSSSRSSARTRSTWRGAPTTTATGSRPSGRAASPSPRSRWRTGRARPACCTTSP